MNKSFLIFTTIIAFVVSCDQSNMRRAKVSGYEYQVYKDEPGRAADVGDYVYFQMDIYDDTGELLQTYRNQRQMPAVQVSAPDDPLRAKNPLVDVVASLSLEDSVGIIIPKDSIPDLSSAYSHVKYLEYRVRVKDIISEEAFQEKMLREREEQAQRAAEYKQRIPEIDKLAVETLAAYKAGKLELDETARGVKILVHEIGSGDKPQKNWMTTVQYKGMLVETGETFDASFEKGRGYTFRIETGNAITGWHEAIPELPVGSKASIFIPSELGYGSQGYGEAIPPDSELYFYVEVEDSFY